LRDKKSGRLTQSVIVVFDQPVSREQAIKEINENYEKDNQQVSYMDKYDLINEKSSNSLDFNDFSPHGENRHEDDCHQENPVYNNYHTINSNILNSSSLNKEECLRSAQNSTSDENRIFKRVEIELPPAKQRSLEQQSDQPLANEKVNRRHQTYDDCAREILNFWSACGLVSPRTAKQEKYAIGTLERALRGTLFNDHPGYEKYQNRKFSVEEIKLAVERFKQSAFDPLVRPANPSMKNKLKKQQIGQWILNDFVKNQDGHSLSQFIKNFESEPKKISVKSEIKEDKHPEYTEAIKEQYVENALSGMQPIRKWSAKDENKFIDAAANLNDFIIRYNSRINQVTYRNGVTPKIAARWLVKAVVESEGAQFHQVSPSWLVTETTWNNRFPQWLVDQNIIPENGICKTPEQPRKRMSQKEWIELRENDPEKADILFKQAEREMYAEMGRRV